jgi:hypothetical protein
VTVIAFAAVGLGLAAVAARRLRVRGTN